MTATKFIDNVSEKDIEIEPEPEPRPKSRCPDGGWGWMIVFGSFVCNVIVDGICFTFGIYVTDIMNYYGADHSKSALVGSLLVGCYLLAGPIVSALACRFGCRKVTIIGSVITCVTFVISTHSPSIEVLLILYGVVGGIGLGLIYLPSIVIIGYWFERKRAFATGIALCGSGIGSLIFAPLHKYLLSEYDWRQSIVIVGGIVLHCAVCGALFRPLEKAPKNRMKRGIVTRGLIMKALIAEKERQRTISNGSLDNCIITKDNKLIKIDKIDLRNKSTSYLNRLKTQLGFSSGSLNRSKNSLIISPIVKNNNVILNITDSKPVTPVQEKKDLQATTPVRSTRRKRDYERRRDSGCGSLDSPKNQSYDPIPQDDIWDLVSKDGEGTSKQHNVSNSRQTEVNEQDVESGNLLDPCKIKPSGSFLSVGGRSSGKNSISLNNNSKNSLLLPPGIMGNGSIMTVPPQYSASVRTLMEEYHSQTEIQSCFQYIAEMFDLSLLKNRSFDLYAFTSFLSMLGFFIPYFFLPVRVKELFPVEGVSNVEALVIAVIGLSNAIGRVMVGWIADRPWANTLCINNWSLVLAGVITILCPYFTTKTMLVIFSFAFGLFTAAFLSLRSIVLVDLIGLERLTSSFGLIILFQGLASVAGSPLAGWIMDQTGSVNSVFYMSGALLSLAGILGCPLRVKRKPSKDCENDCYEYPMNSEAEMLEQVKLGEVETRM